MANAKKIKLECQVENNEQTHTKKKMSDVVHATTEDVHIKMEIEIEETEIKGEIETEEVIDLCNDDCETSSGNEKGVNTISEPVIPLGNNVYGGLSASVSSQTPKRAPPLVMLVPMQEYLMDNIEVLKRKHTHAERELKRLGRENKRIADSQREIVQLRKENEQLIRRLSNMCSVNINKLLVLKIRTELMQVKREVIEMMKECRSQSPSDDDNHRMNLRSGTRSTNDRVQFLRGAIKEKVKKCVLLEKQVKVLRAQRTKNDD